MDDVTASIIIACQTAGAVNSISKLGFALGMLGRKAIEFGAESIGVFSDLQEETQKFGTVFAGVQNEANKHVQELINNFGQSELSARRMMAQTGDLLRGAGFDKSILTYLSSEISKYGADLTSFSNYAGGAEQATFALTKAMLGEQEMAKSLGVFIKYDSKMFKDLEKQALSTGLAIGKNGEIIKARNEIEARAMASFYEIVRQKSYVLGDFWRNQGSIANQSRTMANRLDELKATIGGFLDSIIRVGAIKGEFANAFEGVTLLIKENALEWSYRINSFINESRGGLEIIGEIAGESLKNAWDIVSWFGENWGKMWQNSGEIVAAVFKDIFNTILFSGKLFVDFFMTVGKSITKAIIAGISGEDMAEKFKKEFSNFYDRFNIGFADLGKNTEIAISKAGIAALELKPIDFTDIIDRAEKRYSARQREIDARRENGGINSDNTIPNVKGAALGVGDISASMQSIADELSRFRQSSQNAILSNSVEALRLQSRRFSQSPEMKVQQDQLSILRQIKTGIDKIAGPSRTTQLLTSN